MSKRNQHARPGKTKLQGWVLNELADALDAAAKVRGRSCRFDAVRDYIIEGLKGDRLWPPPNLVTPGS